MLKHVKWQMKNLPRGLGDKIEDWVDCLHQWGIHTRKATSHNMHPNVLAQVEAMDVGNNKQILSEKG